MSLTVFDWSLTMFGFLGNLAEGPIKATVNTALLPVEVVKDAATMFGSLDDHGEPHIFTRLKEIQKNLDDSVEK